MTESNPQNRRLGYARVSTYGQTHDAQLDQLRKAGCTKIFREKVTGARADRRELLKMLKAVAPGDVVTVTRIDRLARSTFDLFAIVKQIVDAKGQFRSLAEPWADTATAHPITLATPPIRIDAMLNMAHCSTVLAARQLLSGCWHCKRCAASASAHLDSIDDEEPSEQRHHDSLQHREIPCRATELNLQR
jgi:hypothetical protein